MSRFFGPFVQSRTYLNLIYLLIGLPLGIFYFVFLVTGLSLGFGLLIIWIGVGILLAVLLGWRALAAFERALARLLLDVEIVPPTPLTAIEGSVWTRIKVLLRDPVTWKSLVWLFLRFPAGIASFVIAVVLIAVPIALITAPVTAAFGDFQIDGDPINSAEALVLVPVGIFVALVAPHVVNGIGWLHATVARFLLGRSAEEKARVLRARTGILEERARLARELHDAVGHTVTVMVMQAGAGRHVFETNPDFARTALENIETRGRSALAELDRILGLLREDGNGAGDRAPRPSLARLDALVAQVRGTGLPVELEVRGPLGGLPSDLDQSAYRIVQEALTNVMKHAGPVDTRVTVQRTPAEIAIEVVDEGSAAVDDDPDRTGHGLVGVRERVALYGGRAEIGPRPEGGYRVWVSFPLDGGATT